MPNPLSRRLLTRLVPALGIAAFALAGCADRGQDAPEPSSADSSMPSSIRIGYQSIPNGDLIVKRQGLLEKALPDTEITWTKFDSGGDVNTAFVAGSIDFGLVGSSPVARGLSAPLNIPYQVAWIHDVIGDAESLVAKQSAGASDIAGLKGKKVAAPFASTAHFSLLAAMDAAGVSESEVDVIDLQPPDILAAWKRGDIDAAYVWNPTLGELQEDGTVLTTSTEVAAQGKPTYDLGAVSTKFADAYPEAVAAWVQAQDQAVQQIKADPTKAAADVAAELNIAPEDVTAQFEGLQFLDLAEQRGADQLGTPEAPGKLGENLLAAAEFLNSQGEIETVPELTDLQGSIAVDALAAAAGS